MLDDPLDPEDPEEPPNSGGGENVGVYFELVLYCPTAPRMPARAVNPAALVLPPPIPRAFKIALSAPELGALDPPLDPVDPPSCESLSRFVDAVFPLIPARSRGAFTPLLLVSAPVRLAISAAVGAPDPWPAE